MVIIIIIIFPLSPDIFTGYYGYVPAVGKAAIRMNIAFISCHRSVHLIIDL